MKITDEIRRSSSTGFIARAVSIIGDPVLQLVTNSRAHKDIDLSRLKSILIVRLDKIGDVVLTIPFLRELRRNAPKAWITLVVNPETQKLVEFCPYVNEVLGFEGRLRRLAVLRRRARAVLFAKRHLWRRFELAIVPRWGPDHYDATLLAYLSGAPHRVAYSEYSSEVKARLNRGYDRLLTQALEGKGLKHEMEWNLNFLQVLGGQVNDSRLELWLTERDRAFAKHTLAEHGVLDGELLVALAPGAGEKKKCWPLDRWIELGQRLKKEFALRLVLVGSGSESELGERIESALRGTVINLVGLATLRQTSAILERCLITVSNDSGPMHLGAAAGSAVVEICWHPRGGDPNYSQAPLHFRPWGVPHVVVQPTSALSPCSNSCEAPAPHCILGIEVESVQLAVRQLLSNACVKSLERRETLNMDLSRGANEGRFAIANFDQVRSKG